MTQKTPTTIVNVLKSNTTTDLAEGDVRDYVRNVKQIHELTGSFKIYYKPLGGLINTKLLETYRDRLTPQDIVAFMFFSHKLRTEDNLVYNPYNNKPFERESLKVYLGLSESAFMRFIKKLKKLNFIAVKKETIKSVYKGNRRQTTKTFYMVNPYIMKNKTVLYNNMLLKDHFERLD